ncbi:Uncharacterised protein [Chlamydia abortus]|nr:Uncharacterised protein [Chlamydia abortus]
MTKAGIAIVPAIILGKAKYAKGFTPKVSIALTCSVIRIVPKKAEIAPPTLPERARAVRTGPISTKILFTTKNPIAQDNPWIPN